MFSLLLGGGEENSGSVVCSLSRLWIRWSGFESLMSLLHLLYFPTQIRFWIGGEQVKSH